MSTPAPLPDPALIVLVGPSGSGKSTWAAAHYRANEIVSSDELRAVAGSGPNDLDASADAFDLLDRIVGARLRRGLSTVIDTLGMDVERRLSYLAQGRAAGIPCVAVIFTTPSAVCRSRNSQRDRPVPAAVITRQLRAVAAVAPTVEAEGWDRVVTVDTSGESPDGAARQLGQGAPSPATTTAQAPANTNAPAAANAAPDATSTTPGPVTSAPRLLTHADDGRISLVLNISRFPWGQEPAAWLRSIALAADEAGFVGIALMDHLIQIPQVGRAWDPIPEPFVTLGLLAGLDTRLHLGTLVSPVSIRQAGVLAKTVATLDALSGGRAFCGLGAGWFEREHAAFDLPFPSARERVDAVERAIETIRALWATGTKPYKGQYISLPETTCYPRPVGDIPIIVGGRGARMLGIAARSADGCNVPSDPATVAAADARLTQVCDAIGRPRQEVALTVLDTPIIGHDRDDVWRRVERLRGRTPATTFAKRHHAGTIAEQVTRYRALREQGVSTVFVALHDLDRPEDLLALSSLGRGL